MKSFLLILDGWGLGPKPEADAIAQANTPFFDQLWANYPHSTLTTFGEEVGLPEGQMGNSEVGHQNIGAGRIVWQELARINKAVRERELHENSALLDALDYVIEEDKSLHLVGLVSDGGVHSHIEHLKALCSIAAEHGVPQTYIHAFTDGRDCDPKSGAAFMDDLLHHIKALPVDVATVIGRYYGMDRDKRWERVKLAYDLLVDGVGTPVDDLPTALREQYAAGITDEFMPALVARGIDGEIQPGDAVLCFNFRTDRLRELTEVLTQQDMPEHGMHRLPLRYVTMTSYDDSYEDVDVLFTKDNVDKTLGEIISAAGLTQVRIAETEKYPHVTFFFSGGREEPFEGERRFVLPSPKDVATYDLKPAMSAPAIAATIIADIRANEPDFICLNFANTDMVGHTGVFAAATEAAETVDRCLADIIPVALEHDYACLLIADHGNSDYMVNEDGTPNTAHTMNPVPCILVQNNLPPGLQLQDGKLADVAPTILELMDLPQPVQMTGESLIV
jgi:2,3-bisphosphoglycerate-independent phosphoglycerate mutase